MTPPARRSRPARAVSALVPQQVGPGVELLEVEQGSAGRRDRLSVGGSSRNCHGSVTMVLTRVSTVSPSACGTLASTTGSQVHSAAQCATSTSAGPSCSRNSLAGWCRRSLVT